MTSFLHHALAVMLTAALTTGTAHAGRLGVFTSDSNGFDTHTFYYDDGQEVTLIDTQFVPALTQAMVEQVRRETQSPITRVIVTHPNPDKFNGLAYLHSLGVASISSRAAAAAMPDVHAYKKYYFVNIAKMFTEENYPKFENVKATFSGQTKIHLKSGETLSLFELKNPGVTSTQVVVRIDKTGDLIVGDLVHHKAHVWLEGAIVNGKPHADLAQWAAAVAELPALAKGKPNAKVYGGRGEFVPVAQAVQAQRAYLLRVNAIVDDYLAQLGARRSELDDPATAQPHYQALEKRLVRAFPDYALPYMIKYSIYGLVGTKLQSGELADLPEGLIPARLPTGELVGYRLSVDAHVAGLEHLGLQPGDIIIAVHGLPLVRLENRSFALERLRQDEFASVTYVRHHDTLVNVTRMPEGTLNGME
ncbi:MAG: MBL fold metallo-hydrolase [Burkholderiaceae bacterium]|nr:MAG: MBL fold metallo-hydrolase [Burkholderiaceae bacterium]